MTLFLWIGSAVGAVLGLLHAIHLYRQIAERAAVAGATGLNGRGLYYGIWTFALWTIFGSYVLAFWLLGTIAKRVLPLIRGRHAD